MPISHTATEFDTFFTPTRVWLFGKRFGGLEYRPDLMGVDGTSDEASETSNADRIEAAKRKVMDAEKLRLRAEHDMSIAQAAFVAADTEAQAQAQAKLVAAEKILSSAEKALADARTAADKATQGGEFDRRYASDVARGSMPPNRIERTLRRGLFVDKDGKVTNPDEAKQFARIYSFSYEGHYYRLPRPLLFLLEGEGTDVRRAPLNNKFDRFSAAYTGVDARDWSFSFDIRVWTVDRKDLAVCLDVEIGNYQEILLDSMVGADRTEEDRSARSRGDVVGRGAGSFRGDMIGPHQNKFR